MLLSVLYFVGWPFGMLESVAFTIVVGLSVDYSVHLVISYLNKLYKYGDNNDVYTPSRFDLVKMSVAEIGSSIISGALTTSSSVIALLFCQISFFFKFGAFVFTNILLSFIATFTFLLVFLLVAGPQRKSTGSLTYFIVLVAEWVNEQGRISQSRRRRN
eukprot:TRINITY_DN424_c1_g2_i1.p1 TRINITY_DN424_c1_g2~~TRINITY_DN424_c1_g2_i1.p1  ORF type:complete len:159 (+),score=23.34 TRINITY_DN424_c1_g2_i1:277-753(+)